MLFAGWGLATGSMTADEPVNACEVVEWVGPGRIVLSGPHSADEPRLNRPPSGGMMCGSVQNEELSGSDQPWDLVSRDALLSTIEQLTAIGAYAGWRHSTTSGEAAARAWLAARLEEFPFLGQLGLQVEEIPFRTSLGIELRDSCVFLTVGGVEHEVPADALPGDREVLSRALRFDSDGAPNDDEANPVTVTGAPLFVDTVSELQALSADSVRDKVVAADFALFDRSLLDTETAFARAAGLLGIGPAAVVLVTRFSNQWGQSHGTFSGDVSVFNSISEGPAPPILKLRLEDLAPLGIEDWSDLQRVTSIRVNWDADVVMPGESASLIARVPGADPRRAVILGAHYDSANSPGAMDDGSGVAVLIETARVLDLSAARPAVDLYLCFFGSHERGLYGSSNFVNQNGELLDRTIAMLQTDCLTHPLDGIEADLFLEAWPYTWWGNREMPWPDYLSERADDIGIDARPLEYLGLTSDNSSFAGSNVPGINLIFMNPWEMEEVHRDGHLHDPYDAFDLARLEGAALESMARIAVTAALRTGQDLPDLRVTPVPSRRALFAASHTEGPHMTPAGLTDFGMALAWEGWDVDIVPYGIPITAADLEGASLVIVPPVHDYPAPGSGTDPYDEAWSEEEASLLADWTERGGLLMLADGAHRLKYYNQLMEENEDRADLNALAGWFGVEYIDGELTGSYATATGSHPLLTGVAKLRLAAGNGVPFEITEGTVLATAGGNAMAITPRGEGEVLVLADLGMLGSSGGQPYNLTFWLNLARYAKAFGPPHRRPASPP